MSKTYHMGRDIQGDLNVYCPEEELSSSIFSRSTFICIEKGRWLDIINDCACFKGTLKKHILPMEFFD